jgi:hypothetical protein
MREHYVCLCLTPFHLKVLNLLQLVELKSNVIDLFIPKSLFDDAPLPIYNRHYFSFQEIGFKDFVRSPLKKRAEVSGAIRGFQKMIELSIGHYNFRTKKVKILIFNEKSYQAQCLIHYFENNGYDYELLLADEGMAFYIKDNYLDCFKKMVYPFFTKLLFGFGYQYFKTAGTHKRIKKIFIRYPELIENRRFGVEYCEFKLNKKNLNINFHKAKSILIVSSPLSEFNIIPLQEEESNIHIIVDQIKTLGYKIDIKPHPKERVEKFDFIKEHARVFGKKELVETINLSNYQFVINFGSSVILEFLDWNYPPKRIITFPIVETNRKVLQKVETIRELKEIKRILENCEDK